MNMNAYSNNSVIVDAKEFLKKLRQVNTATAKKNDPRTSLTMNHIRMAAENAIIIEATDAHVLEQATMAAQVPSTLVGKEFFASQDFVREFTNAPTKHGDEIIITPQFEGEQTAFRVNYRDETGEFTDEIDRKKIVKYPNLDQIIWGVKQAKIKFSTSKKEIYPVLTELKKLVKAYNEEHYKDKPKEKPKFEVVELNIDHHGVKFYGAGKEIQLPIDKLGIEENQQLFITNFNPELLLKQLRKCANNEKLSFGFYSRLRPFAFDHANGMGIVTPVRVH